MASFGVNDRLFFLHVSVHHNIEPLSHEDRIDEIKMALKSCGPGPA
jgi:hypothetical protein